MSRTYFNGVSRVSYNGHLLSFALDDTFQRATAGNEKIIVVELISELETVEGMCRYMLGEIEKIKKLPSSSTLIPQRKEEKLDEALDSNSKLGPKLNTLRIEHGSD